MFYVVRGDLEGLDVQKCNTRKAATCVMLEQILSRIELYGINGEDGFEISADKAYLYSYNATYEWQIIKGGE